MAEERPVEFRWCRHEEEARILARFFYDNRTSKYISHSELQGLRAITPDRWSPDLDRLLKEDFAGRVGNPLDPIAGGATKLCGALSDAGADVGVFLVTFSRVSSVPHCVLEDIVIGKELRRRGYGKLYLEWITSECRKRSISRIFLESRIDNADAHRLFEHQGFETISVVMMKEI